MHRLYSPLLLLAAILLAAVFFYPTNQPEGERAFIHAPTSAEGHANVLVRENPFFIPAKSTHNLDAEFVVLPSFALAAPEENGEPGRYVRRPTMLLPTSEMNFGVLGGFSHIEEPVRLEFPSSFRVLPTPVIPLHRANFRTIQPSFVLFHFNF